MRGYHDSEFGVELGTGDGLGDDGSKYQTGVPRRSSVGLRLYTTSTCQSLGRDFTWDMQTVSQCIYQFPLSHSAISTSRPNRPIKIGTCKRPRAIPASQSEQASRSWHRRQSKSSFSSFLPCFQRHDLPEDSHTARNTTFPLFRRCPLLHALTTRSRHF